MPTSTTSVVIPTYNSARTLSQCLESVHMQTKSCAELVIVDKFSGDNTIQIARKYGASIIQTGENRSVARNTGFRHTSSSTILFLDSDMRVPPDLIEECEAGIGDHEALVIPEVSVGSGFWAECKSLERRTNRDKYVLEAARCFSRDAFLKLGGFDPHLEAGEDWDLQQRAIRRGFSIGRLKSNIVHEEGYLTLTRAFMNKYLYGRTFGDYLRANPVTGIKQVNPISRILTPSLKLFSLDPVHAAGMVLLKGVEYAGVGTGFLLNRSSIGSVDHIENVTEPVHSTGS